MVGMGSLILLVAAIALVIGTTDAARDLLATAKPVEVGKYKQCGGAQGSCMGANCKDAPWTGYACADKGFQCYRVHCGYWQCDTKQPKMQNNVCTANNKPSKSFPKSAFVQCGGKGGSCSGSKAAKCKDAQWPANQGGTCYPGLQCHRKSEWYYACDTHP